MFVGTLHDCVPKSACQANSWQRGGCCRRGLTEGGQATSRCHAWQACQTRGPTGCSGRGCQWVAVATRTGGTLRRLGNSIPARTGERADQLAIHANSATCRPRRCQLTSRARFRPPDHQITSHGRMQRLRSGSTLSVLPSSDRAQPTADSCQASRDRRR